MKLRTALWGYSKEDVQAILTEFKRRMREVDHLTKEKDALLLDYQQQIEAFKNKETIINEALKDARTIANTILQKAEAEAQALMATTEALTERQLANSREDIRQLDQIRQKITQHEETMRQELFRLIEQQRAVIENFDLSTFEAANQEILQEVAEGENVIQSSKIRVILPSEKSPGTADENAIPLYSLK